MEIQSFYTFPSEEKQKFAEMKSDLKKPLAILFEWDFRREFDVCRDFNVIWKRVGKWFKQVRSVKYWHICNYELNRHSMPLKRDDILH